MNWQLFFTTFVTIFLAEMGDKTQFAALAASAQTKDTKSVMIAVVLALALAGVLGVIGGRVLGEFVNPNVLKWVSGCLFIAVGVWVLIAR